MNIRHRADVAVDGVQRCTRCALVLRDYATLLASDPNVPVFFFPADTEILVDDVAQTKSIAYGDALTTVPACA